MSQSMNKFILSHIKVHDGELKKRLSECTSYSQVNEILNTFETTIDSQLADLESHADGQKLLDELHRYNDIKDMTQALIGSLAIIRGVTAAKLHEDFGLEIA